MQKPLFIICLLLGCYLLGQAQLPQVAYGRIERLENFPSHYIPARHVDIWLPESYHPEKQYAVIYMHDGQMLFDSTTTWNRQEWQVDETLTLLLQQQSIRNTIVVAIHNNSPHRAAEYMPQKALEYLPAAMADTLLNARFPIPPQADNYLRFIVQELKPYIDQNYPVGRSPEDTFIMGSSMGGLISLYALCEYPRVFGGAACLSTHWIGLFQDNDEIPAAFRLYMQQHLPAPGNHKIYFDFGDQTLDALYPRHQHKVDDLMKTKGFSTDNWITHFFPGDDHSEKAWAARLSTPLLFLLSK